MLGEERPSRVGDLAEATIAHLEDADLIRRAEPVLRRAQQTDRGISVAVEGQHGIDQVLERFRPGNRPVLRHVPDKDDRDPVRLRQLHQPERGAADLADAAGRPVEVVDRRGLDGVDDQERRHRRRRGDVPDPVDRGLGRDPDVCRGAVEEPEPLCPEPDLRRGLLAGRVQDPVGADSRGDAGRSLEEQRRLADPRLAADEDDRPRDEAPAQHPVELGDPDGQPRPIRRPDVTQSRRGDGAADAGADREARRFGLGSDDRLDEAIPGRAGPALTLPAEEGLAARLADVARLAAPGSLAHSGRRRARRPIRPRPGSAARRRGCRGRPRGRGRRRSSCPARTCRAGDARRGRPRPCSGSPGGAVAHRTRRRSRA